MPNQTFPPVPPTPREYWEDNDWANAHIAEIAEAYPNHWVAVVDKQVVASGKIISDVRKAAETKTGKAHFPIVFAERGIHVYTGQSPFSNQDRFGVFVTGYSSSVNSFAWHGAVENSRRLVERNSSHR